MAACAGKGMSPWALRLAAGGSAKVLDERFGQSTHRARIVFCLVNGNLNLRQRRKSLGRAQTSQIGRKRRALEYGDRETSAYGGQQRPGALADIGAAPALSLFLKRTRAPAPEQTALRVQCQWNRYLLMHVSRAPGYPDWAVAKDHHSATASRRLHAENEIVVDAEALQELCREASAYLDLHKGVRAPEPGQDFRHDARGVVLEDAESHHACAFVLRYRAECLLTESQHATRITDQELSFARKPDVPSLAREERRSGGLLQALYLHADGGLGAVQRGRSTAEPATLDCRHEDSQQVKLQGWHGSRLLMDIIIIIRFGDTSSQATMNRFAHILATTFALLAAFCLGIAVVTSKLALRTIDARRGAAISIASSLVALLMVSLFVRVRHPFSVEAAGIFALVGFAFPALVTLLRFHATDRIGAAVTSAVLATATPLFALAMAALWTDEPVPGRAFIASCGVVCGLFLITYRRGSRDSDWQAWWLIVPLGASAISGAAQVGTKAGLKLWPEPLCAALIGYLVSLLTILAFLSIKPPKRVPWSPEGVLWFAATGALNGIGVLSMFAALNSGSVALIAPIVATYPLVTLFLGAFVLEDETVNARKVGGAVLAIASIAYLVTV